MQLGKVSQGKPSDPLCCIYGTLKDIGNIIANVESMVIKTFLIRAPKLLPVTVCPISSLFIFKYCCNTCLAWLSRLLKADFVTAFDRILKILVAYLILHITKMTFLIFILKCLINPLTHRPGASRAGLLGGVDLIHFVFFFM